MAREWTRSPEEDASGLIAYRPSDWSFPVARAPRAGIELRPGGELVHKGSPAPGDRRSAREGRWELDDGQLVLRVDGDPERRFAIQHVDEQHLLLRPQP